MQHSAGFTSLLGHRADIAAAERAIERRRAVDERRAASREDRSTARLADLPPLAAERDEHAANALAVSERLPRQRRQLPAHHVGAP